MTKDSMLIINSPGFGWNREKKIKNKTAEIQGMTSETAQAKLHSLSSKHFYSYSQLTLLLKVSNQFLTDAHLNTINTILSYAEMAASQLTPGSADVVFNYFNISPAYLCQCLEAYPAIAKKLSLKQLLIYGKESALLAKYILLHPELRQILDENPYARYEIYQKHKDDLFLADKALSVFDVHKIYQHEQTSQDKRMLPEDWQHIAQFYQDIINLKQAKAELSKKLTACEKYLKLYKKQYKKTAKNYMPESADNTEIENQLNILKQKAGFQSDHNHLKSNIKKHIKNLKLDLKNTQINLDQKMIELRNLAERTELGKKALDIFLRKQSDDKEKEQSYINMKDLIRLYPKYMTLIDERHLEALFALIKNHHDFLSVYAYLAANPKTKLLLEKFLKKAVNTQIDNTNSLKNQAYQCIIKYVFAEKILTIEEKKHGKKFLSKHIILTASLFKNNSQAFSKSLATGENSKIKFNTEMKKMLEKNRDWLNAEHILELNNLINKKQDAKLWEKYLQGKKDHNNAKPYRPLDKLKAWVYETIKDYHSDKQRMQSLFFFLKKNNHIRGKMALGKTCPDTISHWVRNSDYDPEVCRLIALDSHLFSAYQKSPLAVYKPIDTKVLANEIYINAHQKFNVQIKKGFFSHTTNILKNYLAQNSISQDIAFIMAYKYWSKIADKSLLESQKTYDQRIADYTAKSPFFKLKRLNSLCKKNRTPKLKMVNLALSEENKNYFEGFISEAVQNSYYILLHEITRHADFHQLIQLAQNYPAAKQYIDKILISKLLQMSTIESVLIPYALSILSTASLEELIIIAQKYPDLKNGADKQILIILNHYQGRILPEQFVYIQTIFNEAEINDLIMYVKNQKKLLKQTGVDSKDSIINNQINFICKQIINKLAQPDTVIIEKQKNFLIGLLKVADIHSLRKIIQYHAELKQSGLVLIKPLLAAADAVLLKEIINTPFKNDIIHALFWQEEILAEKILLTLPEKDWLELSLNIPDNNLINKIIIQMPGLFIQASDNYPNRPVILADKLLNLFHDNEIEKLKIFFERSSAFIKEFFENQLIKDKLKTADIIKLGEINNKYINIKLTADQDYVLMLIEYNFEKYADIPEYDTALVRLINENFNSLKPGILLCFLRHKNYNARLIKALANDLSVIEKIINVSDNINSDLILILESADQNILNKIFDEVLLPEQKQNFIIDLLNNKENKFKADFLNYRYIKTEIINILDSESLIEKLNDQAILILTHTSNKTVKIEFEEACKKYHVLQEKHHAVLISEKSYANILLVVQADKKPPVCASSLKITERLSNANNQPKDLSSQPSSLKPRRHSQPALYSHISQQPKFNLNKADKKNQDVNSDKNQSQSDNNVSKKVPVSSSTS